MQIGNATDPGVMSSTLAARARSTDAGQTPQAVDPVPGGGQPPMAEPAAANSDALFAPLQLRCWTARLWLLRRASLLAALASCTSLLAAHLHSALW